MNNIGKIYFDFITLALIVVGALNWGFYGMFGFNLVKWIAEHTSPVIEPFVYTLIGIAAILHLFARDYYLPFLGHSVYPCGSLTPKTPRDANTSVTINVEPNVNVVYWASEPNAKIVDNPWLAYSEYENTGVARSDPSGKVTLKVRTPAAYKVPRMGIDKTLKPHIHYRTCNMTGLLSRVETIFLPDN